MFVGFNECLAYNMKPLINQIFKDVFEIGKLAEGFSSRSIWLFNATKLRMEWISPEFWSTMNLGEMAEEKIASKWKLSANKRHYSSFTDEIALCLKQTKNSCSFRVVIDHKLTGRHCSCLYYGMHKSKPQKNNKDVFILGVFMDVSAPQDLIMDRAVEQSLQKHFIHNTDHAHYLLDHSGTFLELMGREPHPLDFIQYKDAVGKNVGAVFPDDLTRQLNDAMHFLRNSKESSTNFEYNLKISNANRKFQATLNQLSPELYLVEVNEKTEELLKSTLSERRHRLQEQLLTITRVLLTDMNNFDRTIMEVMKQVGEAVDCDRMYIFKYDYKRQVAINTYDWYAEGIPADREHLREIPMSGIDDRWMADHLNGECTVILNVNDLPDDFNSKDLLLEQGIKSLLTVPVGSGDELQGFVGFDWVLHYFIPFEEQINLLKILADIVYASIKQSETLQRLALENKFATDLMLELKVPFVQLEKDGTISRVNKAFSEMVRMPVSELIGQTPPYTWWPADEIQLIYRIFNKVKDRSEYEVRVNFIDGNQRKFPVQINGRILVNGENELRYVSIIDRTQQVSLEQNLAEMQNWLHIAQQAAGLAHFVLNLQTLQLVASVGLKKLIGFNSEQEPTLEEMRDMICSSMREKVVEEFAKIIEKRLPVEVMVDILRPDNGKIMNLSIQGVINYSRSGEAIELQAIIHDMSNEMEYIKEIEQQNKRFKEITWMHSHELRTPLIRLMSVVDSMDIKGLSSQNQRAVQLLQESADDMDKVIGYLVRKAEAFGLEELEPERLSDEIHWEVVLVDDDMLISELAESMIQQHLPGKKVIHFENGTPLIDTLRNQMMHDNGMNKYLVFLDINMPSMDGWQVLERISEDGMGHLLKVVMFSSSISSIDKKRALKFPFVVDFIEKPLRGQNIADLTKMLNIN